MKPLYFAGLLFATAVVSGIAVAYLSVQGSYRALERDTQFLREALQDNSRHRAFIYAANLETLLDGETDDAIIFNCMFLESELAHVDSSRRQEPNASEEMSSTWVRARELVNRAEKKGLCRLRAPSENEL